MPLQWLHIHAHSLHAYYLYAVKVIRLLQMPNLSRRRSGTLPPGARSRHGCVARRVMPENLREEAFDLWMQGEAGASGTAL